MHPHGRAPDPVLEVRRRPGALKRELLRALWDASQPLTAGELRDVLGRSGAAPALTTVLTVLDRMRTTGEIVRSRRSGRQYEFAPAQEEAQAAASSMLEALLAADDRSGALTRFSGALSTADAAHLRRALGTDRGH